MRLLITNPASRANDRVTISSSDGVVFSSQLSAKGSTIVDIPTHLMVTTHTFSERLKGIHVTSTAKELSVVAVSHYRLGSTAASSTSSFKILPYERVAAKEYFYYALSTESNIESYSSEILLVAYEDNTKVTIASPDGMLSLPTDVQQSDSPLKKSTFHQVILHRMQTLLIWDPSQDLTGTLISSNKQLARQTDTLQQ